MVSYYFHILKHEGYEEDIYIGIIVTDNFDRGSIIFNMTKFRYSILGVIF